MEASFDATLILTLVVMLVGLAGSVLPGLPGVPLIFASALVYAYLTGFEIVGAGVLVLLALFAVLAFVSDFLATTYGARRFGASGWGTAGGAIGGLLGALAGALVLGIGALFGILAGTIGGVFLGEYLRERRSVPRTPAQDDPPVPAHDWQRTSRAAGGALVGFVFSAVAQGILGLLSVAVFIAALFV